MITLICFLLGSGTYAQSLMTESIESNINGGSTISNGEWYSQPWIWAIIATLLILIIGVLSRNSMKEKKSSNSDNKDESEISR